jgi:dienelactone hydrolase
VDNELDIVPVTHPDSETPAQAFFLDGGKELAFVTFHPPAAPARGPAVLICPPFGWEEVCAYRSLRWWAKRLASEGYGVLRLTLPSTGDSAGGARDPDRLGAWLAAVTTAATWLRAEPGAQRVVALGIGLGGLLAALAAAGGAPIDDLVLWGVPPRGRTQVRQLRALSKLERPLFFEDLESPAPLPSDELEAGGFLLDAETLAALDGLDLTKLELPAAPGRRALLLERDGLAINAELAASLERAGLEVTTGPGAGFGQMTSHPQLSSPPLEVIERVMDWLAAGTSGAGRAVPVGDAPRALASAEIPVGPGLTVRETPVAIPHPGGDLPAVLTEPLSASEHGLAVLLLNAGAVRRIGPNRSWVEASRRWATMGVPTLRVDVEGVGDAPGEEGRYRDDGAMYDPSLYEHVFSAMDFLQARGTAQRFVLTGLCASANWSLHCALRDERVSGLMLINLRAVIWDPDLDPARDLRALFSEPLSLSRIRRVATAPRVKALIRWLIGAPFRRLRTLVAGDLEGAPGESQAQALLEVIVNSGRRVLLLFSEREPVYEELLRSGRSQGLSAAPNVSLERIPVRDHTLRPVWAQAELHAALDRALAREPGITLSAPPSP